MSTLKHLTTTVLAASLATSVLAGDFGSANAPDAVGRLVPEGAWGVAYIPSFNHLLQEVMTVGAKIDPAASQGLMMAPFLFAQLATVGEAQDGRPAPPAQFHMDKPMAVAFGPNDPELGEPTMTIIMSTDNADEVVPAPYGMLGDMHATHLSGSDYISFSTASYTPQATPDALMNDLFKADLSLSLDQTAVVKAYADEIDQMMVMMDSMSQMATQQGGAEVDALAQLKIMLYSFSNWSVGIDLDGTNFDLLAQYVLSDSTPFPKGVGGDKDALANLARRVPGNFPIQFLMAESVIDVWTEYSLKANTGMYPAETQAKLDALMPSWKSSLINIKDGMAGAMAFTDEGMSVIQVMGTKDAANTLRHNAEAIEQLNEAELGITFTDLPMVLGDGAGYTITFNMEQWLKAFSPAALANMSQANGQDVQSQISGAMDSIFGGESLAIRYVAHEDLIGVAASNNNRMVGKIRGLLRQGNDNPALMGALNASYAVPTWAMSMNVGDLVQEMYPLILTMAGPARVMMPPSLPESGPITMNMVGSVNGDGEQIRVQTDLGTWIDYGKKLEEMAEMPQGDI